MQRFPAGMEPMGIERHGRSPQVERAGASEWSQREAVRHRRSEAEVADREPGSSSQSIEPTLGAFPLRVRGRTLEPRSRREWSRRESSDIDEARRVSERERTNQSNQHQALSYHEELSQLAPQL